MAAAGRRCDASIFARRGRCPACRVDTAGRCLAGCAEGSGEEAELKGIVDAIEALWGQALAARQGPERAAREGLGQHEQRPRLPYTTALGRSSVRGDRRF